MASEKIATDKLFKNNKLSLFVKLFLGLVAVIFFILLSFQYFQQDEWHSFGIIQSYGSRYITLDKPIWELLFSDRVGARTIIFILFNFFSTNSFYYSIFAASVHLLNSYLVYLLSKKITRSKLISVVALLFFFFNSLGHQAYSWLGTMSGSATSVTFILFSIIFYFNYMSKKSIRNMMKVLISIWFSFLFKESGFFIFPLLPVIWFLFEENKKIKFFLSKNWLLLAYGIFVTFVFVKVIIFIPGVRANYASANESSAVKVVSHLIAYPIEGVGQSFIPSQVIFNLGSILTQVFVPSLRIDTSDFDKFYTIQMTEILSIALSLILIAVFIYIFKKYLKKDKIISNFLVFSIAYLSLSFFPYVILDKGDAYLDSRYYYMGLVGSSFIFSTCVFICIKKMSNARVKIVLFAFLSAIFLSHIYFLFSDLFSLAMVGLERRSIISQIENKVPTLGKKTVFYINGNSPGYYGIVELKVPFQSGLGEVLLVSYGLKGQVNKDLFKEKTLSQSLDAGFLYDTLAQGYKEINGRGFGYYYDKNILSKELKRGKLSKKNVTSLFYDSYNKQIIKQ